MFQKILSALGLAPKNLDEARSTFTEAKGTLDSVAALFTAAGLNLEQLLAAGPDSLKAHLEGIDNTEELAAALLENTSMETQANESLQRVEALNSQLSTFNSLFAAIGFKPEATATPEQFKAAHEAFVSKQTTLALAKTGHPPAHVPAAAVLDDVTPKKTAGDTAAAQALTDYEALIIAHNKSGDKADESAKADFYAKNSALITRGLTLRRRK